MSTDRAALKPVLARFELIERLGEGGMGQVWRARDPELDREVAIKLLHPELASRSAKAAAAARARLRREAQAMAKLQHPNVIAVYEVGEADEQVFLVMELVTGGTLRDWLARGPHSVTAIIDVFVQAGRGLVAAHAASLVHRDFKPENVLVGVDGRARVTDFGLVGVVEHETGDARALVADGTALTRTGTILGTPAYLAPEVLRGEPATVTSDQFSFCVALYEALWKHPPFAGDTVQQLFQSVTTGAMTPPPRRPPVRAAIRDAITRGLAVDPAARWPSMEALLAALSARPRAAAYAVAGGVLAIGAGIAVAVAVASGADDTADNASDRDGRDAVASTASVPQPVAAPVQLTELGGCADYPVLVDDATVVFEHYDGTQGDLYRVAIGGGAPVRLDGADADYEAPVVSAAGEVVAKRIADDTRVLDRVRLDGQITPLGPMPDKSSDTRVAIVGDAIYYLRKDNGQLRRRQGGLDVEVVNLPADRRALNVAASPDGRWLVIGTARTIGRCVLEVANPAGMRCEADPGARGAPMMLGDSRHVLVNGMNGIWKHRLDGSAPPVQVATTRIEGLTMSATTDGRAVVYSDCLGRSRLSTRDPSGAVANILDGRHLELAARGDGALAMVRYVGAEESLIAVRDPAGQLREVSPRGQLVREPSWSVDGKHVAYRVPGTDGGIYVVDVAPLPPRRVSARTTDIAPVFLADGRIAVARYEADQVARLWILDPATMGATRVDDRAAWPYDRHPVSGALLVGDLSRHRMWLWDPATGTETEVARGDRGAADYATFTRDGTAILAVWGKELWRLPIAGGAGSLVFTAPAGIDSLGRAVELPDGTVAFTQHFRAGDIHRVDLPAR